MKRVSSRLKNVFVLGLILILIILILNLNLVFVNSADINAYEVSNGNQIIDQVYEKLGSAFASIFAPIFNVDGVDDFLFAKILLFIMLFAVIFMALKNIKIFKHNKTTRVIVGLVVAILAVRYLKETDFMRVILLPYGALGGSITLLLPIFIYFFFVHTSIEGGFGRRFAWFIYGVLLIFLWGTQEYMGNANWIYIAVIIFVLINLFFDKTIHSYFELGKYSKVRKGMKKERAIELIDKIKKAINAGSYDKADELEEEYKHLIKR